MNKVELLNRLIDIEWDDFEAKDAHSELPKTVWETVSAFSNMSGGWVVLGVSQKSKKFEITGVENPGNFPLPISELLNKDISLPRNPVIAKLFRNVKLAENAGYGFDKMLKWEKETRMKVNFENSIAFSLVTFNYQKTNEDDVIEELDTGGQADETGGQVGGQADETGGQVGGQADETGGQVDVAIEELLTDRQIEILNIIKNNPFVSRRELSTQMNVNESAIQKHLDNLKKKGFIEREGKTTGYWKMKNE